MSVLQESAGVREPTPLTPRCEPPDTITTFDRRQNRASSRRALDGRAGRGYLFGEANRTTNVGAQVCLGDRRARRTDRLARAGIRATIPPASGRRARGAQSDDRRVRRRSSAPEPDAG